MRLHLHSYYWPLLNPKNHAKNNDFWTSDVKNYIKNNDFWTSDVKNHAKNKDFWTSDVKNYIKNNDVDHRLANHLRLYRFP